MTALKFECRHFFLTLGAEVIRLLSFRIKSFKPCKNLTLQAHSRSNGCDLYINSTVLDLSIVLIFFISKGLHLNNSASIGL